jgi:transposase
MSEYIKGTDKNQFNMIPLALDEMISEDNPVRVIDALVDSLDMKSLEFKYANPKKYGRKPYDPKDLLKLYIYGYFNGIRTTRKLEKEANRNIEVMWLLNNLKPDDKTISNFRKDNNKALTNVFKQFSMLCDELGLYGKEIIAVDGSKFRANNSRRKNMTKRKVKKVIEYYENKAKEYLELLEHTELENEKKSKIELSKTEINEKIENVRMKIKEFTKMAEDIEKNGELSTSDPDSRHMGVSNNGTDIAHNVQTAVDAKHHLVVTVDVVSCPADQTQLHNITKKAIDAFELNEENKTSKGKELITVLADKGYYSGVELLKCKQDNVKTIVPKQKGSIPKSGNKLYLKDNFIYDKNNDTYTCPKGQILVNVSKATSKEKVYRNSKVCDKCLFKDECTSAKRGKSIRRGPYQNIYDEVNEITAENKELYKKRQMIVEHPFGTVKRTLGFSYFLTRGNTNVKVESFMHFFTYNLIRTINIIGVKELVEVLKAKISCYYHEIIKIITKSLNIRIIVPING